MPYFSHSPKTIQLAWLVPRHVRACCDELGREPFVSVHFLCVFFFFVILCGFCFVRFFSPETRITGDSINNLEQHLPVLIISSLVLFEVFFLRFVLHVLFCHLYQYTQSDTLRVTSPWLGVRIVCQNTFFNTLWIRLHFPDVWSTQQPLFSCYNIAKWLMWALKCSAID